MAIHYPNGKSYLKKIGSSNTKRTKNIVYGKRGMSLEDEINESNKYYLESGIAVIHKKPTPVQIVDVFYPKRSAAVIKKAYFKQASTTDYNGVYQGKYIDFEAKETKNKTSFPLSNFHEHQINHMKACCKQDGVCFTIVKFVADAQIFLMPSETLFYYWDRQNNGRKSIPKEVIAQDGFEIAYELQPRIPYLKYVDRLINK
ncbi:Holliday junction resolvase RecU [Ligilactobacillus apodemi]|uniref:Holliday junction resolvase RecU n=1 Tax=Ligilactobacillus apodemi TaxID=307126 RepID=UPI00214BF61E|nr:Holliday junction resolvase RecU [Ligilactobacillus apodemi]MCR1900762.1 Holliday junction resolvase RecU [Ligilactobacillus apodemi]